MRLLTKPKEIATTFSKLLSTHESVSFAVAWASVGFDGYEVLKRQERKIKTGIIGTHFHQTHPDFIEAFNGNKNVRFILEADELFHPKLFLFESANGKWACIIGSANFTKGGFLKNNEICVVIADEDKNATQLKESCCDALQTYWKIARSFKKSELEKYKEVWGRYQRFLKRASGCYGGEQSRVPVESIDILTMSWRQYVSKLEKGSKTYHLDERIKVLQAARDLFGQHKRYRDMSAADRKGIAGFVNGGDIQWRWFGSMQGAGRFMATVSENNSKLSQAIDGIPLRGAVTKDDYMRYVDAFCTSFIKDGEDKGHGIATATRLLSLKRPDYFICLDTANAKKLHTSFGIRRLYNRQYERYWDEVVERILDATWWNEPRPSSDEEAEIWDSRSALLDAFLYDYDFKNS